MNIPKQISPARCGTDQAGLKADSLPLKRADDLNLGDLILFANWDGVEVREVMSLAWEGEDVLMSLAQVGVSAPTGRPASNVSTSPGNTFRVIA
jgi:hypothetical protein